MGQGDTHIIECKMKNNDNVNTEYEYAFVDIGTSSKKTGEVVERISKKISRGKVSHIFLTHPDKDHISFLSSFKNTWLYDGCKKNKQDKNKKPISR